MALEVFDYRTDVRNVVILPEIRARFIRMEPGQTNVPHSHDLGHEVFLVLEGEIEFEIAGQRAVLSPGQMCVAYRDELHALRCVSDEPATFYISVTPHVEPTHTRWDRHGAKLPPEYGTAARAEREEYSVNSRSMNRRHRRARGARARRPVGRKIDGPPGGRACGLGHDPCGGRLAERPRPRPAARRECGRLWLRVTSWAPSARWMRCGNRCIARRGPCASSRPPGTNSAHAFPPLSR